LLDLFLVPIAVLYLIVVGLLFVYGINFFYLTYITLKNRGNDHPSPQVTQWPHVTIQLPVYNELYVVKRLVDAAASIDYPEDLLEIQVLDDSTDETREILAELVDAYQAQGVDIVHIHRERRNGYKAGALAEGLAHARGELIAIFDADFVPPRDFLLRTIPFFQDVSIAFVQTRWGHINRDFSFLTFLQSLSIDAHFVVEQFARSQAGYWFNFNGTAGVWRRKAIEDAGGWTAETLTEDLDLSYRAFLNGWEAVYRRDIEVRSELPVSFSAYRRQQHRWARGSFECALKLIPQVWQSPIPLINKMEATLHLTGYGVHILLFALGILYPLILLLSQRYANLISLFGLAAIFNATAIAPTVFFLVAQDQLERRWWRHVPTILFISAMGAGMMLNTVRAAMQAFRGSQGAFERTPKFGIDRKKQKWYRRRYQLKLDPIVFFELIFALLNLSTAVYAYQIQNWVIAFYAILFSAGLLFTAGTSFIQSLSVRSQTRA
jgi:cellulose synthase/poly-beta-1,6-N-acetylglucosamine synthase-like glycosyltransferase